MKILIFFCVIGCFSLIARAVPTTGPATRPTDGMIEYTDSFKVQQPYDLQVSDRFLEKDGVYTLWNFKGDKPLREDSKTGARCEMRWSKNWTKIEHMWEADVMFDAGTDHTCLMQVKSNTGGEAVYLQVQNNGNLYNDNNIKNPALTNYFGKWFHVVSDYNPTTGLARVWINGELKITRNYKRSLDTVWYFKNGTYNTSGASKAHFKNIRFWEAPSSATEPADVKTDQ